jgi:hypothetical protein
MKAWYRLLLKNWNDVLGEKYYAHKYIVNLIVCYWLYIYFTRMLVLNRFAEGKVLRDKIQLLLHPIDFSIPIFILTYACIVAFIIYIIPRPRDFYYSARAFLVVFLLRFSFIHLVPLHPPKDMIFLVDPVLDMIVGDNHEITNDLFFSGHVADISIFIFCCYDNKALKYFMIASVAAVGSMLVWQHVHYTADVLAAPFFAYASYVVFTKKGLQKNYAPLATEHTKPAVETVLV